MSSDYIPRLRAELVRAAERKRSPWRRVVPPLRPLIAAAAVALVVVAVVVAVDRGGSGSGEVGYSVAAGSAERAAEVMRERLEAGGVRGATVSVGSDGRLAIDAPPESLPAVAALSRPGEFAIYDWETSVLGPGGEPAPGDPEVTGAADAGYGAATSRAEAEARAAAGGGVVVRTPEGLPERWYALGGEPALTSADVASAEPIRDRFANEAAVALELTERGKVAFSALTRDVTRRGADAGAMQHFAIIVDDRIVSIPHVSHRENPDGIDSARTGIHVSGGLTAESARRLAAMLGSGPLPAELLPAG